VERLQRSGSREEADNISDKELFRIPGVNYLGLYGRRVFAEFTEVFDIQEAFDGLVDWFVRGEGG